MPTKKDLIAAVAFCANHENHFPRPDEGCRGASCQLHPFRTDEQEQCVRCIECVLKVTLEYFEAVLKADEKGEGDIKE